MKPIDFKMANRKYHAPKHWDAEKHGECAVLSVLQTPDCIYSCWKPSFWERVNLLFGQPVKLIIASNVQPPVALEVGEP